MKPLIFIICLFTAGHLSAISKEDIVKLLEAKMSEDVIINMINSNPDKIDVSAVDLIELKEKGASDQLLNTILSPNENSTISNTSDREVPVDGYDPEEVIYIKGSNLKQMSYIIPKQRTAARALGFGGVASYSVLMGPKAEMRIDNNQPQFIVSVPEKAQPGSYITLASFATRQNGSREVLVGGGYASYSTGIHPDRIMKISFEKLEDQSKAHNKYILYKVNTVEPLKAGEYAVILSTANYTVAGYFGGQNNSCFDFGIDPEFGAVDETKESTGKEKNPVNKIKSFFSR